MENKFEVNKPPTREEIPEYIMYEGKPTYVLCRKENDLITEKTEKCRFCGKKHQHPMIQGHRDFEHIRCKKPKPFIATDGTILDPKDGYYVVYSKVLTG